jgi:hypothetical protein
VEDSITVLVARQLNRGSLLAAMAAFAFTRRFAERLALVLPAALAAQSVRRPESFVVATKILMVCLRAEVMVSTVEGKLLKAVTEAPGSIGGSVA